uniref:Telomerase reverse transcriptase n=3 Tax=Iris tectorum TaxID=114617 RepID=Q1AN55_9ASPA|nr:telomerase [Iris tectorum]
MPRKRKPPPVLHKSLNGRSRSLGDAILSLLPRPPPPSPEQCRSCRGRLCLACLGRSHLVDDEADPTEYRNLLARSFCYVPPSAPPPPLLLTPCGHTQRKVVRNTVEKLMSDPKSRVNLLCIGYDEQSRFSSNGEALCTHAWDILLERIGDRLMVFLLEHSSIFLYLTNRSYQQVTGPPLSEMLEGCTRKRRRVNYEEKVEKFPSVAGCTSVCDNHDDAIQSSATTVGSRSYLACGFHRKSRKHKRLFSRHRVRKHKKLLLEPVGPSASDRSRKVLDLGDGNSVGIHELSLSQDAEAINNEKSCSNNAEKKTNGPLASTSAENNGHAPLLMLDNPPDKKSHMGSLGSQSHLEMNSHCFHGFKLGTAGKVATDDKINRRRMFYNTSWSSSVFQKDHILNQVKPDGPGAVLLLEHIFGLSIKDFRACSCHDGASASSSDCSYHCLLGLLKSLIRNSQNCLHKKMLRKCCPSTILKKYKKDGRGSASEVEDERSSSIEKRSTISEQSSCNLICRSPIVTNGKLQSEQLVGGTSRLCASKSEIANCHFKYDQVVSFIWSVTRRITPVDFLGDASSMRALISSIAKFVALGIYEDFSLDQCLYKLHISRYKFFSNLRFSRSFQNKVLKEIWKCKFAKKKLHKSSDIRRVLQHQTLRSWVHWFFSEIVVPLISSSFYVTERQGERNCVFYYPKAVWVRLVRSPIDCLDGGHYRLMEYSLVTSIIKARGFGFSRVRLIPKKHDIRIIANARIPSKLIYFYKSINTSLKELHAVLKTIKQEHPQLLGSSVFGYNEIHKEWSQFLPKLRGRKQKIPNVYIVVADVAKAFDSIDQDKLLEILKGIVENDRYFLREYTHVVCTKKCVRTFTDRISCEDHGNNNQIIRSKVAARVCSSPSIIIDQGRSQCVDKKTLHSLMAEHLLGNILRIGWRFYLQKVGICQGGSISSLLCSFYLAHLERSKILPHLEKARGLKSEPSCDPYRKKDLDRDDTSCIRNSAIINLHKKDVSLETDLWHRRDHTSGCTDDARHENSSSPSNMLLRLIDDFLFISTSKEQATTFFNRVYKGFGEYNCNMNNSKFGLNFDLGKAKHLPNRLYTGADGIQFLPWSGLLINCRTLEIQADYTRYLNIHIRFTITVQANDNAGSSLKAKLCDYMHPKCNAIFYDSNINSSTIVRLNAYQAFLLCAMKFHCYVCSIPHNTELNPSYLLEIIERSFRYMYKLVKNQIYSMKVHNTHPVLRLKREEMIWLGLSAYIWILKKKQARHKKLLKLLRCKLSDCGKTVDDLSSLKYATEDSHSSVFQDIKF